MTVPVYPVSSPEPDQDWTAEEILDKFGPAKIRAAVRLIPQRHLTLVEGLICRVCAQHVDVKVLGLFAAPGGTPTPESLLSFGQFHRLTEQSEAVMVALHRLWAANFELDGMCGHEFTVDASADVKDFELEQEK